MRLEEEDAVYDRLRFKCIFHFRNNRVCIYKCI